MDSGFRRTRRGWVWWCTDHPRAGRRYRDSRLGRYVTEHWLGYFYVKAENRCRSDLSWHLTTEHPDEFGDEW